MRKQLKKHEKALLKGQLSLFAEQMGAEIRQPQGFEKLEAMMDNLRAAEAERGGERGQKISQKTLGNLLMELAELSPPQIKKSDKYTAKLYALGESLTQEVAKDAHIKTKSSPNVLGKANDLLNGAVVHAAAEAKLRDFGAAWLKGKEDGPTTRELQPFTEYFRQVKRPVALSMLRKKLREQRAEVASLLLEPNSQRYNTMLTQMIDEYFALVPSDTDLSGRTTKDNLLAVKETLTAKAASELFDPSDTAHIDMVKKSHLKNLSAAYNKSIARTPEILNEPLENAAHPMHDFAVMTYSLRWAQLAEILQNEIKTKYDHLLPGIPAKGMER